MDESSGTSGEPPKKPNRRARAARPREAGKVLDFTPPAAPAGVKRTRVAITGGAGILGAKLVRLLMADPDDRWDVVVFDLAPAPNAPAEVRHRFLDLTLPHADGTVYKLLKEEKPDVLVHLAALRSPTRDTVYAHELNALGALHVLAAAGEAKVHRVVLGSSTFVYGARGDNPNFLSEEHPLRPDVHDRFVGDFVEAEKFARDHQRNHPEAKVVVLRFAPFMSHEVRDYKAKFFELPFVFSMLGYDPLVQALHPDDAITALAAVLDRPDVRGVFNVTPEGVVPLSTVHLLYGTLALPLPHGVAYGVIEALWQAGIGLSPGVHAHYLRYNCVAGNEKARKVLGWTPSRTTLETLLETVRARRFKGRAVDFDALEEAARRAAYVYEQRVRGQQPADPSPNPRREAGAVSPLTKAAS